jgi:hypothetical protein
MPKSAANAQMTRPARIVRWSEFHSVLLPTCCSLATKLQSVRLNKSGSFAKSAATTPRVQGGNLSAMRRAFDWSRYCVIPVQGFRVTPSYRLRRCRRAARELLLVRAVDVAHEEHGTQRPFLAAPDLTAAHVQAGAAVLEAQPGSGRPTIGAQFDLNELGPRRQWPGLFVVRHALRNLDAQLEPPGMWASYKLQSLLLVS